MEPSAADVAIIKVRGESRTAAADRVAREEPLDIQLGFWDSAGERRHQTVSVTMRTPGDDQALAKGFLLTEGILRSRQDIEAVHVFGGPEQNTVRVDLKPGTPVDLGRLERHFYTSSSCGVCGKASIDAVRTTGGRRAVTGGVQVAGAVLLGLPGKLRAAQAVFEQTGGLHACALFDVAGGLKLLREDVGRHNALDKLIGVAPPSDDAKLSEWVILLSGRASFELIQKAFMADIAIVCAVGAPSSLAVAMAREFNMTLVGFLRDGRFNIYAGESRIT